MDSRLEQIITTLTTPPPQDAPVLSIAERRANWENWSAVMNEGMPLRPFHAGVLLREQGGRRLTADVHVPDGPGPHPVVLYIHGGAWVLGSPATHRKLTMRFAQSGFLCVSVDYALGPECPFPAGLDDCLFAADWVVEHAAEYGGDASRLGISGDSAGGNLSAAVIATQLAEGGSTPFKAAALIYGAFDFTALAAGRAEAAERIRREYFGGESNEGTLRDPRVSPVFSRHLASFPPSQLYVGTKDALLAQNRAFTEALTSAGASADLRIYEEMPHAFLQIENLAPCVQAQSDMWTFLHEYLG